MRKSILTTLLLGFFSVADPASAITMTFDSLTTEYTSGHYQESGFEFSIIGPLVSDPHFGNGLTIAGTLSWHDGPNHGLGALAKLTKTGGGLFDFGGFDLVENLNDDFPFVVISNLGHVLIVNDLGSFTVNWTGVSYVEFWIPGINYEVSIDNVVVSTKGFAAAVVAFADPVNTVPSNAVPSPNLLLSLIGMGISVWRNHYAKDGSKSEGA